MDPMTGWMLEAAQARMIAWRAQRSRSHSCVRLGRGELRIEEAPLTEKTRRHQSTLTSRSSAMRPRIFVSRRRCCTDSIGCPAPHAQIYCDFMRRPNSILPAILSAEDDSFRRSSYSLPFSAVHASEGAINTRPRHRSFRLIFPLLEQDDNSSRKLIVSSTDPYHRSSAMSSGTNVNMSFMLLGSRRSRKLQRITPSSDNSGRMSRGRTRYRPFNGCSSQPLSGCLIHRVCLVESAG